MDDDVALVVAGMGSLGSSLLAGIEAARCGLSQRPRSLADLARPRGQQASGSRTPGQSLATLESLVLGAFELREDDALRAALRAGLVPRGLLAELERPLRAIRAMSGARRAPTRLHLAESLAGDLRGFALHHGCARGVLVCTVPGPAHVSRQARTTDELWTSLEQSDEAVTPGLVYAAAAALAGFAFVAAVPDASLLTPALPLLFARAGLPIAGCGLLGPEVALREALESFAAAEGLQLAGSASLRLSGGEAGPVARAQEIAVALGFGQGALELSCELRGPLLLHRAARALDAALLIELALRAGSVGAQAWMEALFEAPLGGEKQRDAPRSTLEERRRVLVELVPVLAARAAAPGPGPAEASSAPTAIRDTRSAA